MSLTTEHKPEFTQVIEKLLCDYTEHTVVAANDSNRDVLRVVIENDGRIHVRELYNSIDADERHVRRLVNRISVLERDGRYVTVREGEGWLTKQAVLNVDAIKGENDGE